MFSMITHKHNYATMTPAKKKAAFKSAAAKDKVLLTAHDLFYQDGVRATGIDLIIKESCVTKATFYRHYPSKNLLIMAFLERHHTLWIDWFANHLDQQKNILSGVSEAMTEWFNDDDFRGCAFMNSVSELAKELPEVVEKCQAHKQAMTDLILDKLPRSISSGQNATAIAMAIDGAILKAQYEGQAQDALKNLQYFIRQL